MNCAEAQAFWGKDPAKWTDAFAAHSLRCAACLARASDGAARSRPLAEGAGAVPASLSEGVRRTIADERGVLATLRAWSTPRKLVAATLLATATAAAVGVAKPRHDLGALAVAPFFAVLLSFVAFVTAGAVGRTRPLFRRPAAAWPYGLALAVAAAWMFLSGTLHDFAPFAPSADDQAPHGVAAAIACLSTGLLAGAIPLVFLGALDRGPISLKERIPGVLIGAASGFLALKLHCPVVHPLHLILGHGSLALVLLVFALGRELRPRRSTRDV